MRTARRHYIYGSGMHGCLYDYGPHLAATALDAARSLAQTFDRSEAWAKTVARDMYADLGNGPDYCGDDCEGCDPADDGENHSDGAEYCEISPCDCSDVERHAEPGETLDPDDWYDPCDTCDSVECTDDECDETEAEHA